MKMFMVVATKTKEIVTYDKVFGHFLHAVYNLQCFLHLNAINFAAKCNELVQFDMSRFENSP